MKLSGTQRRAAAVTGAVLFLLGGTATVAWPIFAAHRALDERIASAESRLAQYRRAALERAQGERLLQERRRGDAAAPYYLAERGASLAAAELQGLVKRAVEEAGGELISTQGLPAQKDEREVAIRVRARGDVRTLQKMLYALESGLPVLFVKTLAVDAPGDGARDALLINLDLSAFTPRVPRRPDAIPAAPAPLPAFPPAERFSPIVERVLFERARRPSPVRALVVSGVAAVATQATATPELTLSGVLIKPGRAVAILRMGTGELVPLELGASLDEWQLVDVRPDRVVLQSGARTRNLELGR